MTTTVCESIGSTGHELPDGADAALATAGVIKDGARLPTLEPEETTSDDMNWLG